MTQVCSLPCFGFKVKALQTGGLQYRPSGKLIEHAEPVLLQTGGDLLHVLGGGAAGGVAHERLLAAHGLGQLGVAADVAKEDRFDVEEVGAGSLEFVESGLRLSAEPA